MAVVTNRRRFSLFVGYVPQRSMAYERRKPTRQHRVGICHPLTSSWQTIRIAITSTRNNFAWVSLPKELVQSTSRDSGGVRSVKLYPGLQ